MSSSIANKVETKMCLISIKFYLLYTYLRVPLFPTHTTYTIIITTITAFSIFFSHNCSLFCLHRLIYIAEIFKTQLFSLYATRLHTRLTELLLLVSCRLLCPTLLYSNTNSLTNVFKVECLCSRFL